MLNVSPKRRRTSTSQYGIKLDNMVAFLIVCFANKKRQHKGRSNTDIWGLGMWSADGKHFYNTTCINVRFEVFTAVTMKNAVFWDVAPCRYCVNRRFGSKYRLHLPGRKIRERGTSVSRWLQPHNMYTAPHPRRRHSSTCIMAATYCDSNKF
jgi:hypothetical protein